MSRSILENIGSWKKDSAWLCENISTSYLQS